MTNKALESAPGWQRGLIYLLGVIALLGVVGASLLAWGQRYGYAFGFLTSSFVLIALIVIFLGNAWNAYLKHSSPSFAGRISRSSNGDLANYGPTWSRIVPKLPVRPKDLGTLSELLGEVRDAAHGKINDLRKGKPNQLDKSKVRANIFLPRTDTVEEFGEVCGLYIPRSLHAGMGDVHEREVVFRPNEGLTGRVFTEGNVFGAQFGPAAGNKKAWKPVPIVDDGDDLQKDTFLLTDSQKELIHKNLAWIVSFPLMCRDGDEERPMGVLNVDGLESVLDVQEMKDLALHLDRRVKRLAERLAQLPKSRITITVEDLPHVEATRPT